MPRSPMTTIAPKTKEQMTMLFRVRPERGADDNLRLREALRQAGETCPAAREIAEKALAIWPQSSDNF